MNSNMNSNAEVEMVKALELQGQATNLPESQVARQVAEVQAAMVIAKKFPRDIEAAWSRILQACRRPSLAEQAIYEFPRGNTLVTGPSIRLVEVIAQNYANVDYGVVELTQHDGQSVLMAYAWDLETNVRRSNIFTVKHERKAYGRVVELTDPRDIYEITASQGSRRLRSCLLGVLPRDIIEEAIKECDKTLIAQSKDPLPKRIEKMIEAYNSLGVSEEQISKRFGVPCKRLTERMLIRLRRFYTAIKDGFTTAREVFGSPPANNIPPRRGRPKKAKVIEEPPQETPAPAPPQEAKPDDVLGDDELGL